jgi:hypothetical protein
MINLKAGSEARNSQNLNFAIPVKVYVTLQRIVQIWARNGFR